jgi:nucleoside-diphosphate-sugar epimerase
VKILVTGVAGFIGSHLAERLVKEGHKVIGVDCFTDYYPRRIKESNIGDLRNDNLFDFHEADILDINLENVLQDIDIIFHEAAQAGVRASWGANFKVYTDNNIRTTQRLLEAAKNARLKKFIFASSSSVYGDAESYPTHEEMKPMPISPYGVTKFAAEHLCYLYYKSYNIPTISLRYFTVYGPRQRPDMAFHKFIKSVYNNEEIMIFGDGEQTRDFTYIDDIIDANIEAIRSPVVGEVFNIGGGSRITVNHAINIIEGICGSKARKKYIEKQRGDVNHTSADISKARKILEYNPKFDLEKGLANEAAWLRDNLER